MRTSCCLIHSGGWSVSTFTSSRVPSSQCVTASKRSFFQVFGLTAVSVHSPPAPASRVTTRSPTRMVSMVLLRGRERRPAPASLVATRRTCRRRKARPAAGSRPATSGQSDARPALHSRNAARPSVAFRESHVVRRPPRSAVSPANATRRPLRAARTPRLPAPSEALALGATASS